MCLIILLLLTYICKFVLKINTLHNSSEVTIQLNTLNKLLFNCLCFINMSNLLTNSVASCLPYLLQYDVIRTSTGKQFVRTLPRFNRNRFESVVLHTQHCFVSYSFASGLTGCFVLFASVHVCSEPCKLLQYVGKLPRY